MQISHLCTIMSSGSWNVAVVKRSKMIPWFSSGDTSDSVSGTPQPKHRRRNLAASYGLITTVALSQCKGATGEGVSIPSFLKKLGYNCWLLLKSCMTFCAACQEQICKAGQPFSLPDREIGACQEMVRARVQWGTLGNEPYFSNRGNERSGPYSPLP